jgi:hypothetical protein
VAEVDDADLSQYVVDLVIDMVATPGQHEAPHAVELCAPRSASDLRRVLDGSEDGRDLVREKITRGRPVAGPPAQRGLDLPDRSGRDDRGVQGVRCRTLAAPSSTTTAEPALQSGRGDAPPRLDLRYSLQHTRLLLGVELDG